MRRRLLRCDDDMAMGEATWGLGILTKCLLEEYGVREAELGS